MALAAAHARIAFELRHVQGMDLPSDCCGLLACGLLPGVRGR